MFFEKVRLKLSIMLFKLNKKLGIVRPDEVHYIGGSEASSNIFLALTT